ncbi:MAG: hypothetical protein HC923_01200 [Myxococcales bacterium]|nr:hypothetical protein [Myxococcales bacterium]
MTTSYNGDRGERSSKEIQSDLRDIRSDMDRTLDDLSHQLQPERLFGVVMRSFRDNESGSFFRNFGAAVRDNPIPVAMIATGLGALLWSDRRGTASTPYGSQDRHGGRLGDAATRAGEAGRDLSQRAKNAGGEASERAKGFVDEGSRTVKKALQQGEALIHEQPLVLAGLGLALGAALGGATPLSREERDQFGEASRNTRHDLEEAVREGLDQVKETAGAAAASARDEVSKRTRGSEGVGPSTRSAGKESMSKSSGAVEPTPRVPTGQPVAPDREETKDLDLRPDAEGRWDKP